MRIDRYLYRLVAVKEALASEMATTADPLRYAELAEIADALQVALAETIDEALRPSAEEYRRER